MGREQRKGFTFIFIGSRDGQFNRTALAKTADCQTFLCKTKAEKRMLTMPR